MLQRIKTEVFYKMPGEYILLYTYYSTVYIILYHLLGWWPYRAHGRHPPAGSARRPAAPAPLTSTRPRGARVRRRDMISMVLRL